MDNELFELCKEVYERTRWENDVGYRDTMQKDSVILGKTFPRPNEYRLNHEDKDLGTYSVCPVYTTDYLLEKLPKRIDLIQTREDWLAMWTYPGVQTAKLREPSPQGRSDTPLKALLKLCVALHEAGELK